MTSNERYRILEVGKSGIWFCYKGESDSIEGATTKCRLLTEQNLGRRYLIAKAIKYVRAKHSLPEPMRMELSFITVKNTEGRKI